MKNVRFRSRAGGGEGWGWGGGGGARGRWRFGGCGLGSAAGGAAHTAAVGGRIGRRNAGWGVRKLNSFRITTDLATKDTKITKGAGNAEWRMENEEIRKLIR